MENIMSEFEKFIDELGDKQIAFSAGVGPFIRGSEARMFWFLFEKVEELQKEVLELKKQNEKS